MRVQEAAGLDRHEGDGGPGHYKDATVRAGGCEGGANARVACGDRLADAGGYARVILRNDPPERSPRTLRRWLRPLDPSGVLKSEYKANNSSTLGGS